MENRKERPILMNTEMVRAILEGRKTQTRRPVGKERWNMLGGLRIPSDPEKAPYSTYAHETASDRCPYGKVGDKLWVRETFQVFEAATDKYLSDISTQPNLCSLGYFEDEQSRISHGHAEYKGPWRPSIHMPRWASRITLEVVNVRVERVQDISEDDADKEGATAIAPGYEEIMYSWFEGKEVVTSRDSRDWFKYKWNLIYKNWETNPWVWVVEFKVVEA